jgi:phosphatidylserine/phosphatidylglycerophosphate/cardiolipin synthase-like enzyme
MRLSLTIVLLLITGFAEAAIKSYFNNRENVSYLDPYRHVVRSGDDLEAVILEEIDAARATIYLAVQEIRLPKVAKKLVEKYRQGLDVRIVLENSYNHNVIAQPDTPEGEDPESHDSTRFRDLVALVDINNDGKITREEMLERDAVFILQQAKVPMIDDTEDESAGSGLMHHKFMVVDGKSVLLSSANFTPSCIHGDILSPRTRGNANGLMTVTSKPLAKIFTEEFNHLWSSRFGLSKPFRGAKTVTVGGKKITVQFSPSTLNVDWSMTTNGLIAKTLTGAKTSIEASLFVFSEQKLADAMKNVARRADIEVLVERKFAFRSYSEVLDLLGVELPDARCVIEPGNAPWRPAIEKAGVTTLVNGDVLHHKFAVVDQRKVIFGSHNWSAAANSTNDEFLVVLDDVSTADHFSAEHQRLAKRAQWGVSPRVNQEIERMSEFCTPL